MGITRKQYKNFLNKEIHTKNVFKIINNPSYHSIYLIRKAQYYYGKNVFLKILSKKIVIHLQKTYGIFIHPETQIGIGLKLPHPNGIIIGKTVSIGENCTIYQQVTIGSSNIGDYKLGKQPKLKDDIVLFAGSKIIGDIVVESGTTVGANAVLTKNTEKKGIYAGVPAKLIKLQKS